MSPDPRPPSVATPPVTPSCPICETPLQGKQTVCSAKCRVQRSMRQRAATQTERDAKVRLLLRTAIEAVTEAKELLKPEEEPSS